MTRSGNIFLLSLLAALALLASCTGETEEQFLVDEPGLLSRKAHDHLIQFNRALLNDLDIHFKLIVLDTPAEDINARAAELFGDLGSGTGGARGLLFLVDPVGKQVRIEVGYDLEAIFPDIFVGYLEREQMVPFFVAGEVGNGIEATTELFVTRAQQALAGHAFDPQQDLPALQHYSGGGGARIETGVGGGQLLKSASPDRDAFQPQETPQETLAAYRLALQGHIKDPDLPLFTPKTREFFRNWVVTDAQQDNELRTLGAAPEPEVRSSGMHAVVRYPIEARTHAPYFLSRSEHGWQLDFATMSEVLQMNHENMWMMRIMVHPYMFAFDDWRFDDNGFPIGRK